MRFVVQRRVPVVIIACLVVFSFGASAQEQPTVTNVFADTFITEALRDVAFQTGVNIIADTQLQGFVTLDLQEVPLEEALRMILAPGGYTLAKLDASTYVVGEATPGSPMFHLLSETQRYHFKYISADSARKLVPEEHHRFVKFDPQTNTAVVQASPDLVRRIIADLQAMDQPPRQIMIEAVVTELSSGAREELGIDWAWNDPSQPVSQNFLSMSGLIGTVGYIPPSGLDHFFAQLETLVDNGKAEIRANPKVAALSGEEASIFIGQERYYRIVSGLESNPVVRLQAIEAGVSLRILPQVAENGDITVHIQPSVSDVNGVNREGLPEINRRNVSTTVRVKDGETIAIGGLLQTSENEVVRKVPLLGDLPILANLFRSTSTVEEKTEVVVLITPRIIE